MPGWGARCPSSGASGLGDVTLGTMVPINYLHPPGVAVNATSEARRITAIGSGHPGGVTGAMADAATRFVSDSIELPVWHALSTRAGGQLIPKF